MAQIPESPLLRLDDPRFETRHPASPRFGRVRRFTAGQQRRGAAGRQFRRLGEVLDRGGDALELHSDPNGMAPERLLVFELTGDVAGFTRAAARVPGLEFIGAEDLQADEDDKNPVLYLLIPDAAALRQMLSLWRDWLAERRLPTGFAPWSAVFAQLRDLRPWGPRDRVTAEDLAVTRAIRAAAAAGVDIARVEVTKAGTIVIVATAAAEPAKQEDVNEWDTALHDKR
jgi:hypothetical protein